ncbi:MAG TPA: glycine cleavage T C-terminal barrel domain-containing protein [Vicinamibacterales bacterium]|nr:glycine cleavage T C-terminal barrel domain-containing protein [Vicinamibacterales bacterium]
MTENSIAAGGYRALREAAATVDRSALARIVLSGADRRSLLQGLLTNDIEALTAGTGCYAAWLTPQGRMITDLAVLELGDRSMLLVPADRRDAISARLDQSIFSEDVTIEDEAGLYDQIGVDGPRAAAAISRAISTSGAVESLPVYGSMRCESRNASAIVARTDWLGIPGYDILIETPCAAGLREALAQAGVPAVPDDVAQAVRVESGRPLFGVDMDEHTIPLEAGIEDRAISFSKGCYVGQEVIIRVLHRGGGRIARRLVGLTLGDGSGAPPARGQALTADGRDVGRLTSVVHSPALDRDIALGYVARELSEPGTALQLASGVSALVTELPFI